MVAPVESCNSSNGSSSTPATFCTSSEGPSARRTTSFASVPVTINPPMSTLSPVPTFARVDMLSCCEGGLNSADRDLGSRARDRGNGRAAFHIDQAAVVESAYHDRVIGEIFRRCERWTVTIQGQDSGGCSAGEESHRDRGECEGQDFFH